MREIALADPKDRADVFRSATEHHKLTAALIEKDFWVCWTLQRLFTLPGISEHLLFKGGTTLSKVYGAISRFSEDIDISVSREFLRPGEADAAEAAPSKTKSKKEIEELKSRFKQKVDEVIEPSLRASIAAELGESGWRLEPHEDQERHAGTLLFWYPAGLDTREQSRYNQPRVLIEMGGRSDIWPSEPAQVIAYAAPAAPDLFEAVPVSVLAVERTFWEKATLLHNEYYRPAGKTRGDRISRHYYDLAQLAQNPEVAQRLTADPKLLPRVVEHKKLYYADNWSRYDDVLTNATRLVPPSESIDDLKRDYAEMRDMFWEEPPTFDEILTVLAQLEERINAGNA
jgi:predicted nucleotidyltransferase component of viral defense system